MEPPSLGLYFPLTLYRTGKAKNRTAFLKKVPKKFPAPKIDIGIEKTHLSILKFSLFRDIINSTDMGRIVIWLSHTKNCFIY